MISNGAAANAVNGTCTLLLLTGTFITLEAGLQAASSENRYPPAASRQKLQDDLMNSLRSVFMVSG
jgi:hypothetical protein